MLKLGNVAFLFLRDDKTLQSSQTIKKESLVFEHPHLERFCEDLIKAKKVISEGSRTSFD